MNECHICIAAQVHGPRYTKAAAKMPCSRSNRSLSPRTSDKSAEEGRDGRGLESMQRNDLITGMTASSSSSSTACFCLGPMAAAHMKPGLCLRVSIATRGWPYRTQPIRLPWYVKQGEARQCADQVMTMVIEVAEHFLEVAYGKIRGKKNQVNLSTNQTLKKLAKLPHSTAFSNKSQMRADGESGCFCHL